MHVRRSGSSGVVWACTGCLHGQALISNGAGALHAWSLCQRACAVPSAGLPPCWRSCLAKLAHALCVGRSCTHTASQRCLRWCARLVLRRTRACCAQGDMGPLLAIKLWHEGKGLGGANWNLERIIIDDRVKMTRWVARPRAQARTHPYHHPRECGQINTTNASRLMLPAA